MVPTEMHSFHYNLILISIYQGGTSLVVRWLRLHSQCRGPGFDPWSGNQIPYGTTKTSAAKQVTKYRWLSGKESACRSKRCGFDPWVRKIPWRRKWKPTPVLLRGKFNGQRSLAGYSPRGHKESDTTVKLNTHTHTYTHTHTHGLYWLMSLSSHHFLEAFHWWAYSIGGSSSSYRVQPPAAVKQVFLRPANIQSIQFHSFLFF